MLWYNIVIVYFILYETPYTANLLSLLPFFFGEKNHRKTWPVTHTVYALEMRIGGEGLKHHRKEIQPIQSGCFLEWGQEHRHGPSHQGRNPEWRSFCWNPFRMKKHAETRASGLQEYSTIRTLLLANSGTPPLHSRFQNKRCPLTNRVPSGHPTLNQQFPTPKKNQGKVAKRNPTGITVQSWMNKPEDGGTSTIE